MKVFIVLCTSPKEADPPIFGIYSTKEIAFKNANKIIKELGYDKTKWSDDCRALEEDGYYKGIVYITEMEIDKNII